MLSAGSTKIGYTPQDKANCLTTLGFGQIAKIGDLGLYLANISRSSS